MAQLSIGKKMFLSAGALMVMAALLGITSYTGLSNAGDRLNIALDSGLKKEILAYRMDYGASELLSEARGELVHGAMQDRSAVERYHKQFAGIAESLQSDTATLESMVARPEAKQAIREIKAGTANSVEAEQAIYEAILSGDMKKAFGLNNDKLYPATMEAKPAIAGLVKIQDEVIAEDARQANASIATHRMICLTALILCMGLGGVILFVVRGMSRDLAVSVTELTAAISQIASAATQVASSSQNMAQGASEQAATIEETSSASAEINSMAQRNTENSRSTAEIVTGAQVRTVQTNNSLNEMVEAMDGITASSQKISKIIKVIDEIAFQTNILALNAAVEAARAGDAGMGFAVVADEVRNLAQRSAQAAKDTAGLIEESIQRSNGGKAKVDQVASGIHTVTEETAKIKVLVDEINLGSMEQSRGIDQISRSITEMEQVTQSNAASAEESAAAAEELSSQAQDMREVVERLSMMVGATVDRFSVPTSARSAVRPRPKPLAAARIKRFAPASAKSARSAALAPAGANFPMDDDFKEF